MPDPVLSLFDLVSGAVVGTLEVRLYQGRNSNVGVPQLSDFVEASYTGYERQLVPNPGNGVAQPDGSYRLSAPQMTFSVGLGETDPGCDAIGAYVVMDVGGQMAVAGVVEFGLEIPMRTPGDYCQFAVAMSAKDYTLT